MTLTNTLVAEFRKTILDYYKNHGRHDLPWRTSHITPYHVLVSEIMLQQTGVERVIPKFLAFVAAFPTIYDLVAAPQSEVLKYWIGLGYNRRAIYLHKAAQQIVADYNGIVPSARENLLALPGIGPYAAASIAAFAYNLAEIVIDTNIRTVFIHHFFSDRTGISDTELIPYIESTLDHTAPREWYSALMDYGTHLKQTVGNITRRSRHYAVQSPLRGSRRELRGAILKLLKTGPLSQTKLMRDIAKRYPTNKNNSEEIIASLLREKIISQNGADLTI